MRMLKCRFCDFEIAFARRLKSGKVRMGRETLTWHVREKHPAEYGRIRQFVRRMSTAIPKPEEE